MKIHTFIILSHYFTFDNNMLILITTTSRLYRCAMLIFDKNVSPSAKFSFELH